MFVPCFRFKCSTYTCNVTFLFLQSQPACAQRYEWVGAALECDAPIFAFACSCQPLLTFMWCSRGAAVSRANCDFTSLNSDDKWLQRIVSSATSSFNETLSFDSCWTNRCNCTTVGAEVCGGVGAWVCAGVGAEVCTGEGAWVCAGNALLSCAFGDWYELRQKIT